MTLPVPALDRRCALFLDFDGTLVDLAANPDDVVVEPGLVHTLQAVARALDGAVAVVSGRPIAGVDHWLAPLVLPAAGVHGAERRRADGSIERLPLCPVDDIAAVADRLAAVHPGLRVERKGVAVALHYRQAPQLADLCLATMSDAVTREPTLHLLRGKMVVEVLPGHVSKGHAIEAFLREPPFTGRRAVFVGDDVTDESGFVLVQRHGGIAVKVGEGDSVARHRLAAAAGVRRWLVDASRLPVDPSPQATHLMMSPAGPAA